MLRFREVADYVKLWSSALREATQCCIDPALEILRKGSQLNLLHWWSGRWMGHSECERVGKALENRGMAKDKQHALDFMLHWAVCNCMHGMNGSSLRWGCTVGRDDTSGGWQVTQSLRQMANREKKKKNTPESVKSNPWSSSLWDCCETVNTVPHRKSITSDLSNNAYLISDKRTILNCLSGKMTCASKSCQLRIWITKNIDI